MTVGQEAVITDALETGRQTVLQKTADEFFGRDGHYLLRLLRVSIVFPQKGDLALLEG